MVSPGALAGAGASLSPMGGADREAVGRDGGPTRGRHALAGAVAVAGATAFTQPSVAGSDLWWHLASGREILQRGAPLRVDPFSYSFAGEPWTNHEWLWDVLYWSAYRLHPELAAWLNLAVLVATFALIFAIARRTSGSALAAGAALWAAAATAHWFFDIRPHLFTLLLVSVVLITRHRLWAVWLWPPLMLVWVNLHAGFAFGLGVMGLIALARTADASATAGRPSIPWHPWAALALAAGIIVLNPYGVHVVEFDSMVLLLGECDNNLAVLNTVADPVVVRDERAVTDREFEVSEQGVDLSDTPPPRKPPRSLAAAKGARAGVGVHPRNAVAAANLAGFKTLLRQTRKSASSS